MSISLQIVLLSRDRPNYLREALRSALSQSGEHIEVVVSDNSDREDVARMLAREFPAVRCIRRIPTLGSFDHFRAIIDGATADLLVMFHDDDVLLEGYAQKMRGHLEANPSLAAACCNARILRDTVPTSSLFMTAFRHDTLLSSAEELLEYYLCFNKHRAAPFPGYMYRRTAIQGLFPDARDGGKHADVTFLMNIIQRGPFLWLANPLMQYRMHSSNDSVVEQVGQRLRLLRYIYRNTTLQPKSAAVQEFRFRYWARWWRSTVKHGNPGRYQWRRRIVFTYLCRQALRFALTKPGLWIRIASGAR